MPGRCNDLLEVGTLDPVVFESKQPGFGNEGRDFDFEGDMIRGAPGEGGKDRAR
jgi:hypothetical protein